jgi:hypothetical protein
MIYKFPIYMRSTSIGVEGIDYFYSHLQKYMCVDGLGFLVYYKDVKELTVDNIRRHLMARSKSKVCLMADNPLHAIEKFSLLVPGVRIGGKKPESKAVWVEGVIEEYPDCQFIHQGREGLICGDEYSCPCFLENSGGDAFDGCQMIQYLKKIPSFEGDLLPRGRYEILTQKHVFKKDGYEFKLELIKGYQFARVHPTLLKEFKNLFLRETGTWIAPNAEQVNLFKEELV